MLLVINQRVTNTIEFTIKLINMSISSFIEKISVQPIVYWEPIGYTKTGSTKFAAPVQIYGRWTDTTQVVRDSNGKEIQCKATVLLPTDVKQNGWLMLGELTDLASDLSGAPVSYGASIIGRFDRVPLLKSTTEFVRTAYIGYQQQGS